MKVGVKVILSFLLIFNIFSCRNNTLKTDEKSLAKEILSNENELSENKNYKSKFSGNDNPSSFRYKEIRKIDPARPPVHIDLPGKNLNTGKLKLSDLATSVTYIKLQTPPDTMLTYDPFYSRSELLSIVRTDGNQIVFQGLFGVTRFSMEGDFLETIWKNETGIEIRGSVVGWRYQEFVGVMPSYPVSLINGNLYYSFTDGPAGIGLIMKYKTNNEKLLSVQKLKEVPGREITIGDTILITSKQAMDRFDVVSATGPDSWAGINRKWNSGKTGNLLVTFNDGGDTLCKFSDNEKITNFSKPNYRMAAHMVTYNYNDLLTIKQEYNDTVFRLIPPERLLPAYVLSFGEKGVKFMDGLNPDVDLSERILLNSFFETDNFLLIRYTQNNDSPNNRRRGSVKYSNVLFDKDKGEIIYESDLNLIPEPIENDIDLGISFWPDFISPDGKMLKLVSGKMMKEYINSETFNKSTAALVKKERLISLFEQLKPTDMVIMVVK